MILPDNQDFLSLVQFREINFLETSFKVTANIKCSQVINEFKNIFKVPSTSNISFYQYYPEGSTCIKLVQTSSTFQLV